MDGGLTGRKVDKIWRLGVQSGLALRGITFTGGRQKRKKKSEFLLGEKYKKV